MTPSNLVINTNSTLQTLGKRYSNEKYIEHSIQSIMLKHRLIPLFTRYLSRNILQNHLLAKIYMINGNGN